MSGDRLADVLFADARSRRAAEETLRDIRKERADAHGPWARAQWWARAAVALARVGVAVLPLEVRALSPGAWFVRLLMWTVVLVVPVTLATFGLPRGLLANDHLPLWLPLLLLPQALVFVFPFSLFWTALWPPRAARPSVLLPSLAAVLLASSAVIVMPEANQRFRVIAFEAYGGQGQLTRGLPEMSIPQLARAGFSDSNPTGMTSVPARARQKIALLTGLVVLAGALTVLGSRLATRGRRRWLWAMGMPLALFAATGIAGESGAVWILSFSSLIARRSLAKAETRR